MRSLLEQLEAAVERDRLAMALAAYNAKVEYCVELQRALRAMVDHCDPLDVAGLDAYGAAIKLLEGSPFEVKP